LGVVTYVDTNAIATLRSNGYSVASPYGSLKDDGGL